MTGYIYKITSPSNKIYIGQTLNAVKRQYQYSRMDCKGQVKLYRSIKKYGWDSHTFEILCECPIDSLNEKERYYQDMFNVLVEGLNCRLTGAKDRSGHLSAETIRKIKESRKCGVDHPLFGKKRPEITQRLSKPCIIDGVHYPSAKKAAETLGLSGNMMNRRLNSPKHPNYKYC